MDHASVSPTNSSFLLKLPDPQNSDFHLTDVGNGKRLVSRHGNDVRFCWKWKKWLAWNGKIWVIDALAEVRERAKETIVEIYREAADLKSATARGELIEHAKLSESASRIRAMMEMASSDPAIRIQSDRLDSHPLLLNLQNGTLDLNSLTLRPHNRGDFLTQISPIIYDESATCPRWEKFVSDIFAGNSALIEYVQTLLGYCLTGDVREQTLPIFYGTGSNGKSLLLSIVRDICGPDYSMKAMPDLLMAKTMAGHPTERTDLFRKRLVNAIETEDGRRLAESLVKELSGGDPVRARRMHENTWEFLPTHKIIIASNYKPGVRGTDHGIWRRLALIPFDVTFWNADKGESGPPELKADKGLEAKLKAELSGILNWMLKGCQRWMLKGLGQPVEVTEATAIYRQEQDVIGRFVSDCCFLAPHAFATTESLAAALDKWATDNDLAKPSKKRLTDWLSHNKMKSDKKQGKRGWYGVGLLILDGMDTMDGTNDS